MKISMQLLALAMGASAISAAQAERLDVTLEGTVRTIVSDVYEFNVIESPGGLPFDWGKVGERYPDDSEGFRLGEAFKVRFAFDTATHALMDAELSNSQGQSWVQGGLSSYIMGLTDVVWSLGFPIAKSKDDPLGDMFYLVGGLAFEPGAYPGAPAPIWSATDHLHALAGLRGASAYLHTDLMCDGPGHAGEEVCTTLYAAIDKVTFSSSQATVTVAVPEASPTALALAGMALVGLMIGAGRRRR